MVVIHFSPFCARPGMTVKVKHIALELQKNVNNEVILHIPNLKMDLL